MDPFGPHLARRTDRDLVPRLRQHGSRDERFFYFFFFKEKLLMPVKTDLNFNEMTDCL